MKLGTMKRAAQFGVRHLQTIAEDNGEWSPQMRGDIRLAIAMLKVAPDLLNNAGMLAGFVEAGPCDDSTSRSLHRSAKNIRKAIALGTDRNEGDKL